jgi:hypothetical protein
MQIMHGDMEGKAMEPKSMEGMMNKRMDMMQKMMDQMKDHQLESKKSKGMGHM